ncbi:hypothetical protein FGB62_8g26 [Gracilaria domingensis]|nr:hypothetical protein FGB62_8g26 [Gracilaria domingensis]
MHRARAVPGAERSRGGVRGGGGARRASAPRVSAEKEDEGGAAADHAEEEKWAGARVRRARRTGGRGGRGGREGRGGRGGRRALGEQAAAEEVHLTQAGGAVKQHEDPDLYVPRALPDQQHACKFLKPLDQSFNLSIAHPPSARDPPPLPRAARRRLNHLMHPLLPNALLTLLPCAGCSRCCWCSPTGRHGTPHR